MIRPLLAALILVLSAASARAQSVHVQVDTFGVQRKLDAHGCMVTRDSIPGCADPRASTGARTTPVPPAASQDTPAVHTDVQQRSVSEPIESPDRRRAAPGNGSGK